MTNSPDELGYELRFAVINVIRRQLKEREISQKQYAEILECGEYWLNNALSGEENFTLDMIAKMFWCLELSPQITLKQEEKA